MRLTKQDVTDIIEAIDDAQNELALGHPEADAINKRWKSLKMRFIKKLKESFNPG